jgi:phosphoribosylformimino-5-aminoimidazole carboxamide ribotide isomerase
VRLTQGAYENPTFYDFSTIELAKKYDGMNFKWLHVVDLRAAKTGKISSLPILKEIKNKTKLLLQFGGGIRNINQVDELFECGVDRIIIGSLSIQDKNEFEKIIEKYGAEKFVIAIDSSEEHILTMGWTENSGISIYEHIDYCSSQNIKTFLCTDISKDGTLSGPNAALYEKIMQKYPSII